MFVDSRKSTKRQKTASMKIRVKKSVLEKELHEDEDWRYYKGVEAHRSYLYALSMYKHLRYTLEGKEKTSKITKNRSNSLAVKTFEQ